MDLVRSELLAARKAEHGSRACLGNLTMATDVFNGYVVACSGLLHLYSGLKSTSQPIRANATQWPLAPAQAHDAIFVSPSIMEQLKSLVFVTGCLDFIIRWRVTEQKL